MTKYSYLFEMYKMPKSDVEKIDNQTAILEILHKGLKTTYAKNFISFTNLSLDIWANLLPISKSTLQRQLKSKVQKMNMPVSEALIEIGEIYKIGLLAFDENKKRFNNWLNTKNLYFKNKTPLQIMDTHTGREMIKDELYRIEYSEFS